MTVNWSTHSLPTDPFLAAVSISGLFDLEPFVPTSVNIALGLTSTEALDVSPLYRTRTTTCPFDAIVGAAETTEFLRQNALLDEMWPDVATRSLAGEDHFTIVTQVGNPKATCSRSSPGDSEPDKNRYRTEGPLRHRSATPRSDSVRPADRSQIST